jgi:hypothetical protein
VGQQRLQQLSTTNPIEILFFPHHATVPLHVRHE